MCFNCAVNVTVSNFAVLLLLIFVNQFFSFISLYIAVKCLYLNKTSLISTELSDNLYQKTKISRWVQYGSKCI